VLVPTKLTEGKLEDQVPMRLTMLVVGGLVGLAAWGIGDGLLVNFTRAEQPIDARWGLLSQGMLDWPDPGRVGRRVTADFHPTMSMYVTFFAFLFMLSRWWRQAEFTRGTRLNLWTVAWCMLLAWLVHLFWWFPQPAGMLTAGTVAFATQLASPWMPPSRRRALSEEIERGV
jgi:hypothetical protein